MTLNADNSSNPPMSSPVHTTAERALSTQSEADNAARLAHEMANLLDGSLRNLGLVLSAMETGKSPDGQAPPGPDQVQRLQAAHHAMKQMVGLVQHLMQRRPAPTAMTAAEHTLDQIVQHAVRLHTPAAEAQGITLQTRLDPAAAALPAGPVYPVIANALRNSIEALSQRGHEKPGLVEVLAFFDDDHVVLVVRDDGPGLDPALVDEAGLLVIGVTTKPQGHGLGLELCQQIAAHLCGQLIVRRRLPHGAELLLRYPIASVRDTHSNC